MKKTAFIVLTFFVLTFALYAEEKIDVSVKPEPLPENDFIFPNHTEITLDNGLRIFVIQDSEQPVIDFRLLVAGGTSVENKPGTADVLAEWLTKGAGKRSASEIADALDGVGASISVSATDDYITVSAGSLKKHMDLLLDIMKDVLTDPAFDDDEFEKIIPQISAALKNKKTDPNQIASDMAKKALYGENHPYAKIADENTIREISEDDAEDYFEKYFVPGNATLAIAGDITIDEVKTKIEKAFGSWKKKDVPEINISQPQPMPRGVYFVERPASVQSVVMFVADAPDYSHDDYLKLSVASAYISGGFAGQLFKTLRETYSYTYSPFGRLTSNKYYNRYFCGAAVRNSVTDSAVVVIKDILARMSSKPEPTEDVDLVKKVAVGQYKLSFEKTDFIISLIQNGVFRNVSLNKIKDYPNRVSSINPYEIMRIVNRYLNPERGYLVVVGDPSVYDKLGKFGQVYRYDLDLKPLSADGDKLVELDISAKEVFRKYRSSLGDKTASDALVTLTDSAKATMTVSGQTLPGTIITKYLLPDKYLSVMDMNFFLQKTWINGKKAWVLNQGAVSEVKEDELEKITLEANPFGQANILEKGYSAEVKGQLGDRIVVHVTSPSGSLSYYYFNAKSYLLEKIISNEITPEGTISVTKTLNEYKSHDGIMLPGFTKVVTPMFTMELEHTYTLNNSMDDVKFEPEK